MTSDFMIKNIRFSLFTAFSLSTAIFFTSCNKDMAISLKNENIDNLLVTGDDSLSVQVSTVQLPNIPTSGTGMILVGKVTQPLIGSLKSSSSFRLAPNRITNDFPSTAVFDSINLILKPKYGKYVYGDTTKRQTISAYRITQALETTTLTPAANGNPNPMYYPGASIFGHQSFAHENAALGSVNFTPKMSKVDSLSIKLQHSLGAEFFEKIKKSDVAFNSAANFQEYFKGITLVPAETNTAMVGFKDTLDVVINYSYIGTDGLKKKGFKKLQMGDKTFQYNKFESDRSGTDYEDLKPGNPIPASQSEGRSFIQAGAGIATKIYFPNLKAFMETPGIAINKADLEIEVISNQYGFHPAATFPAIMIADSDIPIAFLNGAFESGTQYGKYILGTNTGKPGVYKFNLVQYIRATKDPNFQNKSLYLTINSGGLFSTGNTTILATQNNKPSVKLNIVYTKFK